MDNIETLIHRSISGKIGLSIDDKLHSWGLVWSSIPFLRKLDFITVVNSGIPEFIEKATNER
jgi:hypothetical protein